MDKLEARLRGYAAWLPADWRIVVVVDRDDDDCLDLKQRLEAAPNGRGCVPGAARSSLGNS